MENKNTSKPIFVQNDNKVILLQSEPLNSFSPQDTTCTNHDFFVIQELDYNFIIKISDIKIADHCFKHFFFKYVESKSNNETQIE